MRLGKYVNLDEGLFKWHQQHVSSGLPVGGVELQSAADTLAKTLGIEGFRASNGWLHRFRKRHLLTNKKTNSEHASADVDAMTPPSDSTTNSSHLTTSTNTTTHQHLHQPPSTSPPLFLMKENDYLRPYKARIRSSQPKDRSSEGTVNIQSQDASPVVKSASSASRIIAPKEIPQPSPVKAPQPPTTKKFYRCENGDNWMEFHLKSPVLSCVTTCNKTQGEESSTSSNLSSFPLETSNSDSNLVSKDSVDDDCDDGDDDPASLLAPGKISQLMKLLRKYRKKNRITSDLPEMHPSSPRSIKLEPEHMVFDDMTQTCDQDTTSQEENLSLPLEDPVVVSIDGVTYTRVLNSSDENALVKYIVKENIGESREDLCKIVYNFCMIYNIARPASWNKNESADMEWLDLFMKRHDQVFFEHFSSKRKEMEELRRTAKLFKGQDFLIYLLPVLTTEEIVTEETVTEEIVSTHEVYDPAIDHNYALTNKESVVDT